MTMIEVEPQPRIDTLVRLPDGADARRTDYVGTVWFDGKPEVSGLMLRRAANAPRGIRTPNFSTSFFLPDSLAYKRATLGDATLSILGRAAGLGPDERHRRRGDVHRPRPGSRPGFRYISTDTWAGRQASGTASSR